MRFYTNVYQRFNEMLVRGYEDGKHFSYREEFYPTFYVPSKKESKYKLNIKSGQEVGKIGQDLLFRNLLLLT